MSRVFQVVVTEVVDANEFYVQKVGEPRMKWITEQMGLVAQQEGPVLPVSGGGRHQAAGSNDSAIGSTHPVSFGAC